MTNRWRRLKCGVLMLFLLSACGPKMTRVASPGVMEKKTPSSEADVPTPSGLPAKTKTPSPTSGGPFLLLQTGAAAYSMIDFSDLSIMPFDPPGPDQQYNLPENLSPSGTQMLFPVREDEVLIYSFITRKTHPIDILESDSNIFKPVLAASAAREALPGLKYSDEALLSAVKNAFVQSTSNIQWFKSDRYHLTALPGSETSTQLTLHDHLTGRRETLENQPGLVEAFWIGPAGEKVLVKKAYMFDPGVWQDDRYYVVDVRRKQANPIPLPENADNPRVFWFSPSKIGIIHHPAPIGGTDFSLVAVESTSRKLILDGQFDNLCQFGEGILTLHQDQESKTSTLTLRDLEGQVLQMQDHESVCFFSASISEASRLMNCGSESVLVEKQDEHLFVNPFREALSLLTPSPDGNLYIQVTQASTTMLLDKSLEEIQTLTLEAPPLEILWLPDSSGLLYRTPRTLYLYQLGSQNNTFLLESDLLGDYRNLNAVWIQLEE